MGEASVKKVSLMMLFKVCTREAISYVERKRVPEAIMIKRVRKYS